MASSPCSRRSTTRSRKLPKATVKPLGTPKGAEALTTVLTYHVVAGQMQPDRHRGQDPKTVEGEKLKVTGSGDNLKVQRANVICGGVKTANATVYLIDSVMMPKTRAWSVTPARSTMDLARGAAPLRAEIGWINAVASTSGSGPLSRSRPVRRRLPATGVGTTRL